MEMIRHGNENAIIEGKMQRWTRQMLLTHHAVELPGALVDELQKHFLVPQIAIKVWGVNGLFSADDFAVGASDVVKALANSLTQPYCGSPSGQPAVQDAVAWLEDAPHAASCALIALRAGIDPQAFGLLVLASPDAQRFASGMGTEFLERLGLLASAALSRLRPQAAVEGS